MEIRVTDFVAGAQNAEGITVIIDVFRAFSVACYVFAKNASSIIPVGAIDQAWALKKKEPHAVMMGEREGKKLPGFDYGNSPTEIRDVDFSGKTVIHTTHAGTQGLVNALRASEILTGAFVNARATVHYIKSKLPTCVTLVRMGLAARSRSDEDDLCARYLESLLLGSPFDTGSVEKTLRASPSSIRFFDPDKPWSPASDFHLCLDVDRFNFAVRAGTREDGLLCLRPVLP
jgi:2-phosphosulfolactate phosphatase